MRVDITVDWRWIAAIGGSVIGILLVSRIDSEAAGVAVNGAIGATKELAIAMKSNY